LAGEPGVHAEVQPLGAAGHHGTPARGGGPWPLGGAGPGDPGPTPGDLPRTCGRSGGRFVISPNIPAGAWSTGTAAAALPRPADHPRVGGEQTSTIADRHVSRVRFSNKQPEGVITA